MEILSDLDDTSSDIAINKPETYTEKCQPLTDVNRRKIAMKFNFCISSLDKVEYISIGNECKGAPVPLRPLGMVHVCLTASLFC